MKWTLVLACMLATSVAHARTPFQVRCEDTIGKTVSVLSSQENGFRIDSTRSYRTLSQMKQGARNSIVLGLTRTESRVSIGVGGKMLSDKVSGYECVAPRIDVDVHYLPIIIYIGSEFPASSCAYREILAHEMRHLQAYRDHLPKVETRVRAALLRRFGNKPLYAPGGQARALLQREIDTQWMPYIKAEMSLVEVVQQRIDSPQEYARLGKVCRGEVQSLIGQARRKPL
ncbi:MAG: hypothetical protein M3Y65_22675 [Pseudomonadota bacterium]|nr:hypothetical protein [Pseudomonadota bacterium]